MNSKLRKLVYAALSIAFAVILFVAGFLQEFSPDDVSGKLKSLGLLSKFDDPRIEVSVNKMVLSLFDGETLVSRYDIGFGSGRPGRSAVEERSTPYGEYRIVARQKRGAVFSRGSRFLIIDYPSMNDAANALGNGKLSQADYDRIARAHAVGERIPVDTPLKGPIGIHGNFFFFRDRRFTDGSVALSNSDLNELFEYVPVGTPVIITE